jgi:hypothetical protein
MQECGLRVERQLNAAVNLYLQMEGLPHDPEWFDRVVGGFALTGEEADEGSNEPWRSPRLLNSQELCKSIKDYIAQNPLKRLHQYMAHLSMVKYARLIECRKWI